MVVMRRLLGGLFVWSLSACGGADADTGAPGGGGSSSAGGTAATGGTQAGGVSVGPSTPLAAVPSAYADAMCSVMDRCWTAFIDAAGGFDGCVHLLERVARESRFSQIGPAVEEGRIAYRPEALAGCLQALESASCEGYQEDSLCPDVFVGQKRMGEACELDEECGADSECLVEASCPGSCGPRPTLGEACSNQNRCAAGRRCATQPDGSQVCVEPARLGEKCGASLPCAGMLFCAGNDTSAPEPSGTCVTRGLPHDGEQGESCDGIGVDTLCKPGLVCTIEQVNGEVVGRCQPQADSGGACSFAIPDACPPGEYCHIETELGVKPATGTCRAQPKLGQACRYGTIHTAPCGNGIDQLCHPDTEVCVTAKGNGEACTHDQECVATDCDDSGHCAARLECEAASL